MGDMGYSAHKYWIEEKLGNCKSELALLLNKTTANDGFFQSTSHVYDIFTIDLYDLKELVLPHLQQAGESCDISTTLCYGCLIIGLLLAN